MDITDCPSCTLMQYFRIGHMGISVMEDERHHIDKVSPRDQDRRDCTHYPLVRRSARHCSVRPGGDLSWEALPA
jgi:hypothetical protein